MKNLLGLLLIFVSLTGWAQASQLDDYKRLIKKGQKEYQAQNYTASLESLNQAKALGLNLTSQWYYFTALNHMKLENDDLAIENFNKYIDSVSPENSTRGYYFLGQIYTKQQKYDDALTHFELASDTSTQIVLDKAIDSSIEQTLRLQRLNDRSKVHNLALFLGYSYDDNSVNLNPTFFEENIKGHTANYGALYSYLFSSSATSRFEPSIAVVDSYTLDGKFKSNQVVQSKDALQLSAVLPFQFSFSSNKDSNLYNLALSATAVYLPINSINRELALSSIGVRYSLRQNYSTKLILRYELNLNFDRSYGFTTEADDASGLRSEAKIGGLYDLAWGFLQKINTNLAYEASATKGANTKYRKYSIETGFANMVAKKISGNTLLQYYNLNYYEKNPVRIDNQMALSYAISYEMSESSLLDFALKYTDNQSNSELYLSKDVSVNLQYSKMLSF